MATDDRLARYRGKRDLAASGEPEGGTTKGEARFVIHRHEASSLHFDFRLSAGDVLKSWACRRDRPPTLGTRDWRGGPSEDHPADHVDFEGRIPEGEYGAGTVVVWDTGPYENLTRRDGSPVPVEQAVADGHVKVRLDGQKIRGGYALTRLRSRGDDEDWLLVKADDEGADRRRNPVATQPESVLSGKTNADLDEPRKDRGR